MRGIYPDGVGSLAEESLLWENAENLLPPIKGNALKLLQQVFFDAARAFEMPKQDADDPFAGYVSQSVMAEENEEIQLDVSKAMAKALHAYAKANVKPLGLNPDKIQVRGFHTVFRVAPSGRLLIELVIQFTQVDRSKAAQFGGIPFRNGCTLIASSNCEFRYLISKPRPTANADPRLDALGKLRMDRQRAYVNMCDMHSPLTPYLTPGEYAGRMETLKSFANLDAG